MKQQRRYLAYLLRLWQEGGSPAGDPLGDPLGEALGDPPLWRASLEWPQSGDAKAFASLEDLFAFLEKETRLSPPDSECPEEEGS